MTDAVETVGQDMEEAVSDTVVAEDVRHLECGGRTQVDLIRCGQLEMQLVERPGRIGDDGGGDVQINSGRCQLVDVGNLEAAGSAARSRVPRGSSLRPARGQAPAVARAALLRSSLAPCSRRATSSRLSTIGSRLGVLAMTLRSTASGRPRVTPKTKRKAAETW